MHLRLAFIPLASFILLSACESTQPIAQKVKFEVDFEKQMPAVTFELDPRWQVTAERDFEFDQLGRLSISRNGLTKTSSLTSTLHADPQILGMNWPTQELNAFPNGKELPAAVHTGSIHEWKVFDQNFGVSLLFESSPDLVVGGRLTSNEFNQLPKNFLATQRFFAPNGDTIATISVHGPTTREFGGVLFLASFGANPFLRRELPDILISTEKPKIISPGLVAVDHISLWLSNPFDQILSRLSLQIETTSIKTER